MLIGIEIKQVGAAKYQDSVGGVRNKYKKKDSLPFSYVKLYFLRTQLYFNA